MQSTNQKVDIHSLSRICVDKNKSPSSNTVLFQTTTCVSVQHVGREKLCLCTSVWN